MARCGGTTAQALLDLVHDVVLISGAGSGNAFKRDCTDLVRRISLLTHLLEEIRDFKGNLMPLDASSSSSSARSSSFSCLYDLRLALQAAKRYILVASNFDSMTSSDKAAKKIAFQFQCVTWKLEKALGALPYDQFAISEEVQEQVDLVRTQLRRATERYGPLNSKSLTRASSLPLDEETDTLQFENRVIDGDEFKSTADIIFKGSGSKGNNADQMIQERPRNSSTSCDFKDNLPNKEFDEIKKSDSIIVPADFVCSISLELMRDPVIVATGQTYERSCIQRWIDCGNITCPKTQQKLENLTLTPNYVLRSLITQWCSKHNIEQPTGLVNGRIKRNDGSFHDVSGDMEAIERLVRKLSSHSIEERRSAVAEIRSLSKRSTDNRILIAEAGAIAILVNLLTSEDVIIQENAVTSMLNLSIYENNKGLIMLAGAIPSIVQVLRTGTMEARENSAATLFSLSLADENKIIIGASGAIPALIELLENGSPRGRKDAATALFNLCIYQGNKGRAVRAGIVSALSKMLTSSSMVDESLTILSVLASHHDTKIAIVKACLIPVLIDLVRTGLARNKENAAAILLSLCKRNNENLACISRLGASIPLSELAKSGTDRAKRKATSLLDHLRNLQHHGQF